MKEEDGMNRRRSTSKWLVGAAVLAASAAAGSSAFAQSDPYNGDQFINFNGNQTNFVAPGRRAGATLNPGGVGQVLFGQYYDVRPYLEADGATSSTQQVNLAIINTWQKLTNVPGQTGLWGGQIARVRFRESKTSQEVLDFDIVLSCAEVWTANVSLPDVNGTPVLASNDQIVDFNLSDFANGITVTDKIGVVTGSGSNTLSFVKPAGLTVADVQRGYFEVIAEETIPCEPYDPATVSSQTPRAVKFNPAGQNTWLRITPDDSGPWSRGKTPADILAGEVYIVRPEVGTSYHYNMTAISRFNVAANNPITRGFITTESPTTKDDCFGPDNTNGSAIYTANNPAATPSNCTNQLDLQLSKRRLIVPYDIDATTLGRTHVVFTFPTKSHHCGFSLPAPASAPFECLSSGELVAYQAYDRIETNLCVQSQSSTSPPPEIGGCNLRLPREVTILQIRNVSGATSDRADLAILIPNNVGAGWVDLDLAGPNLIHAKGGLNPVLVDYLGAGYTQFRGLPVIAMKLQDYINLNAAGSSGGFFGNNVDALHEVFRS